MNASGGRFLPLMLALITLLLLYPWVGQRPLFGLLANVLIVAVGIYAVSGSSRLLSLLVGIGVLHLAALLVWTEWATHWVLFLSAGSLALFYALTVSIIMRQILRERAVSADTICGAVSLYLLLGFFWVALYSMVLSVQPDSLSRPGGNTDPADLTYFSFVTLCTIGYGDYAPRPGIMRPLAILEGIAGVFYMAVLVSRLVSLFGQARDSEDSPESPGQESLPGRVSSDAGQGALGGNR